MLLVKLVIQDLQVIRVIQVQQAQHLILVQQDIRVGPDTQVQQV